MSESKPNCYKCAYRREVPGDCHSRCGHPEVGDDVGSAVTEMMTGVAGRKLGITGNSHGVRSGWFAWPFNFDPVWLESCNGFEPKGGDS